MCLEPQRPAGRLMTVEGRNAVQCRGTPHCGSPRCAALPGLGTLPGDTCLTYLLRLNPRPESMVSEEIVVKGVPCSSPFDMVPLYIQHDLFHLCLLALSGQGVQFPFLASAVAMDGVGAISGVSVIFNTSAALTRLPPDLHESFLDKVWHCTAIFYLALHHVILSCTGPC